MGCCCSSSFMEDPNENDPAQQQSHIQHENVSSSELKNDGVWPFTEFLFSDLDTATENFSSDNIILENPNESSNLVYKGYLENFGFIAVKKLENGAWPVLGKFAEEAKRVWEVNHKRFVNLIGYCCDRDERLLVAQFLPNDTLAKRLFHQKNQTMEWDMRFRVAYCIAEALDYCKTAGFESYNNLSAYTILFDQEGEARVSCFGLMKENTNDQITTTGSVNSESVTYRFGTILVNLLTGKQTPLSLAPEMICGKDDVFEMMDPNLKGKFSEEEVTIVFKLASQCLQNDARQSLDTKELVATLEPLQYKTQQRKKEASSSSQHKQLETLQTQSEEGASASQLMSLGKACSKMDLDAIHKNLVMTKYEDDKELFEVSFEEWLPKKYSVDMVEKIADDAFAEKKFQVAIHSYSKIIAARNVVYPSVYARRCLSYLFENKPKLANLDMINVQEMYPNWPTGYYLQSVALAKTGMTTESAHVFKQATLLEAKRKYG